MKILSSEAQGALFAITSGLLYGLVGFFGASLIETQLSIANMQFWRFFASTLFMIVILLRQFKKLNEPGFELFKTFLFGALFYSASAGIYFVGCKYIGTGPSMVIFFTYPAFVMLLNWLFFRSHIPKIYYLAIGLIVLGMTQLVDMSQLAVDLLGLLAAVLSGILYAAYIVCSKHVKVSPPVSAMMVSAGCAAACLFFAIWDNSFIVPRTVEQWSYIFGFGIISTALPMLLLLAGLRKIHAEKAAILSVTEPIFVVIFGVLLLEETLNTSKFMGIVTILSGALLTLLSKTMGKKSEIITK